MFEIEKTWKNLNFLICERISWLFFSYLYDDKNIVFFCSFISSHRTHKEQKWMKPPISCFLCNLNRIGKNFLIDSILYHVGDYMCDIFLLCIMENSCGCLNDRSEALLQPLRWIFFTIGDMDRLLSLSCSLWVLWLTLSLCRSILSLYKILE